MRTISSSVLRRCVAGERHCYGQQRIAQMLVAIEGVWRPDIANVFDRIRQCGEAFHQGGGGDEITSLI
jgi:hypothetical protein